MHSNSELGKIKVLYANGDSFVFGQELDGPRTPEQFYHFSDYQRANCYTGQIADRFKLEYKNNALPGGSNQRIYRTLISDITEMLQSYQPHEILVLIGITHSNRREFFFRGWDSYYPHLAHCEPFIDDPNHALWKILTEQYHAGKGDHDFDQMMILGIQNFLRVNKIPYLITASSYYAPTRRDEKKYVPDRIVDQRYKSRINLEPSFAEYTWNLPIGPQRHPLTDAHTHWANYVGDYIVQHELYNNSDL